MDEEREIIYGEFHIRDAPQKRSYWLRQKWYNFMNPEMPTVEEIKSVIKMCRIAMLFMIPMVVLYLLTGAFDRALVLGMLSLVIFPLFEWRSRVYLRDLEMIE